VYAVGEGSALRLVTGVPGAGKTALVRELAQAYAEAGLRVRGVTVANAAAEVLRRETGMPARSVAKELYEWEQGRDRLGSRDVLLVDEVSTLGSAQGADLLARAWSCGAVVVALGDDRQFQAVAHGSALTVLQRVLGEDSVDMARTRRQSEAWQREATQAVRRGEVWAALDAYREHGCVREFATQAEARAALVERWADIEAQGTPCGVEVFTNAERTALNVLARERWRALGRLEGEDVVLDTADGRTPYAVGERVVLRERVPEAGLCNGSAGVVRGIEGAVLRIERWDGVLVAVDTQAHPGVQHGYCSTEYREQGSTRYAELQLVTKHVHQRSLVVGMTRHTAEYGMFYSCEEVGSYEGLVSLGERMRSKELASDFRVVERSAHDRLGPEREAQPGTTIAGRFEADEPRAVERARAPEAEAAQAFVREQARAGAGYAAFEQRIAQIEGELVARGVELARRREALGTVDVPEALASRVQRAREELEASVWAATNFSDRERERLERAQRQQESWISLERGIGERTEQGMLHERDARFSAARTQAWELFQERTLPQIEAVYARESQARTAWERRVEEHAREQERLQTAREKLADARRDLGILERAGEAPARLEGERLPERAEGADPRQEAASLARVLAETRAEVLRHPQPERWEQAYGAARERIEELDQQLEARGQALKQGVRELGTVERLKDLAIQLGDAERALRERTREEADFSPREQERFDWALGERLHGNALTSRIGGWIEGGLREEREARFAAVWSVRELEFREQIAPRIEAEYQAQEARWEAWRQQRQPLMREEMEVQRARMGLEKAGKDLRVLERARVVLPAWEADGAGSLVREARALEDALEGARQGLRTLSVREARQELEPIAWGREQGYDEQERAAARLFLEGLEELDSSAKLVLQRAWREALELPECLEAQMEAVEHEWAQAHETGREQELARSIERELGISMSRGRGR
jgi:hypothetical protein